MQNNSVHQENIVSIYFVVNDITGDNDVDNIIKQVMHKSSMHLHHFIHGCGYVKNKNLFFINITNYPEHVAGYIVHTKELLKEILSEKNKRRDYQVTKIEGI